MINIPGSDDMTLTWKWAYKLMSFEATENGFEPFETMREAWACLRT